MLIIGCGRELTERGQNIGVFWFPFTSESVSCTNEICIKAWPRASILSVTLFKNAKVPHLNLRVWNLNTHKHLSTIWYVWIPRAFLCSAYAKLYSHCSCTYVILLPALIKCIKLNVIPWRLSGHLNLIALYGEIHTNSSSPSHSPVYIGYNISASKSS